MRNTLGFFCLNDGLKDYDLTVAKAQQDPQLPWMEEKKAYDEEKKIESEQAKNLSPLLSLITIVVMENILNAIRFGNDGVHHHCHHHQKSSSIFS